MKLGNLRRKPATKNAEEGYFLIVIMIMVAVLAIVSLNHVQNFVTALKRDQEEELVHRGAQYARAVKKYYKKFNSYPVTLDQLDKTNNMRFLRKRYKDPITGADFRLIRPADFLQAQNSRPQNSPDGSPSTAGANTNGTSADGSLNPPMAQSILNTVGLGGNSGSLSGQSSPAPAGQSNSNQNGSTFGQPIASGTLGSGPTFGGGPFIGVASASPKVSLKEFDKKNHYKDWMFVYLPQLDNINMPNASNGALPRLIKGPFLSSQLTGGMAQNQQLFSTPNQGQTSPNQTQPAPYQNQPMRNQNPTTPNQ